MNHDYNPYTDVHLLLLTFTRPRLFYLLFYLTFLYLYTPYHLFLSSSNQLSYNKTHFMHPIKHQNKNKNSLFHLYSSEQKQFFIHSSNTQCIHRFLKDTLKNQYNILLSLIPVFKLKRWHIFKSISIVSVLYNS